MTRFKKTMTSEFGTMPENWRLKICQDDLARVHLRRTHLEIPAKTEVSGGAVRRI